MSSGERPIGTAKGKQSDTEALFQTSLLRSPPWGQNVQKAPTIVQANMEKLVGTAGARKFWYPI